VPAVELQDGYQAHVKRTLTSCSTTAVTVMATEVMIQRYAGENGEN
jgi:hypothetical protein